jgi:glycerol-3-phosphate acyltransferase PlsX
MSSNEFFTLAVDCMGGDHGPSITLPACRHFLDSHPNAKLRLVGQAQALAGFKHERAEIVVATEVVGMEDSVEVALRRKKRLFNASGHRAG